jgi:tetratricopeptide (TPR) repeat protein
MSTTMSSALLTNRFELNSVADTALKASARFWFVVAVIGQFAFAFTVASFYGLTALRGDVQAWNRVLFHGYVAGATMSNTALVGHILFATLISIAGALQLIPRVRERFPMFHRWNGRIYLLAAFTQGITGLYLSLSRGGLPVGILQHVALWISAVLIMICAAMALRYALARDFKTHRRWALRLFLVASASWFFRVGFSLTVLLFGPIGFDSTTFRGPLPTFWGFAEYLLPLAVLEIYLYAQDHPGAFRRVATAGILFVLTLAMSVGIFAEGMGQWLPKVKAAYDTRKSIGETLSATIASSDVDQAVEQYHDLKATALAAYNFDENQLNTLGYELLKTKKFKEAIRIFQLNVEAYPQSSNVYDSLGEGYMDDGNKPLAIANYQKSLELNPKNRNAIQMLQKLNASMDAHKPAGMGW